MSAYAQNEIRSLGSLEAWCKYEARMWANAVVERGLLLKNLSVEERASVEKLNAANGLVLRDAFGEK